MSRSRHDLLRLHHESIYNSSKVGRGNYCSCFNCVKAIEVSTIKNTTDNGATVICPECGVDSLLAGDIRVDVLIEMNEYFFGEKD